jgi:hypothetical protein
VSFRHDQHTTYTSAKEELAYVLDVGVWRDSDQRGGHDRPRIRPRPGLQVKFAHQTHDGAHLVCDRHSADPVPLQRLRNVSTDAVAATVITGVVMTWRAVTIPADIATPAIERSDTR